MNDPSESCSVLLVHDAPEQLEVIASVLERCGFSVTGAETIEDVHERACSLSPDVVVIGAPLAGVDPTAACRAAIGLRRPAVVIAIVDDADVVHVSRLLSAGVCDFVLKQHFDVELPTRIRVHLRARGRLPRIAHQPAARWTQPLPEAPTPAEGTRLRHARAGRAGAARARVLLLEAHRDLGYALRAVLQMRGFSVTLRREPDALLADVLTRKRDAVVLDLAHVEPDLVTLCHGVRKAGFPGPIIATATSVSEPARTRAIDAGATELVTLPELVPLLEARFQGPNKLTSGSSSGSPDSVDLRAVEVALTDGEFKVFEVLFASGGDKIDRRRLKATLGMSDGALEQHIRRMIPKLRIFGLTVATIRGFGYRLVRTTSGRAHT